MNIYVGNLHVNASEEQLRKLFSDFGDVASVNIIMDTNSGQSRGFGFVQMQEAADGFKAIKGLNHQNFMNLYLEVTEAIPNGPKDTVTNKRKR